MSVISAGTTSDSSIKFIANSDGTLTLKTNDNGSSGGTTALTLATNQAATFASSVSATAFSGPLNGTVGATTPNTGAFTTLTATSSATLSGTGFVQLTNTGVTSPSSGTGIEMYATGYNSGAGIGSYTRGTFARNPLTVDCSTFYVQAGASTVTTTSSTGLAVTGTVSTNTSLSVTADSTESNLGTGIQRVGGTTVFWYGTGATGSLAFKTQSTGGPGDRMTLTSSGNLLVGTTSAGVAQSGVAGGHTVSQVAATTYALTVQHTASAANTAFGLGIKYTAQSPNNGGNSFLWCADGGGTQRAAIYSNGGLANYSGNNVNLSDRREKTNFAPAGEYLSKICAIPVQTFNYIDQNLEEDPGLTLGVVAQDVQAVAPELVMESNWGTEETPKMRLSIYQTDLQYALMKAIQELTARVVALESR